MEKTLPKEGNISVKAGDLVKPFDILGYTFLSLNKRSLSVPQGARIMVGEGESVTYDQVLSKKTRFLRSIILRAPFAGIVHIDSDLQLSLFSPAEKFNLVSGIEARVVKTVEKLSVLLETEAVVINGVWSYGVEAVGEIKIIDTGGQSLTTKDLGADDLGKIVVFYGYVSESVMQKAKTIGVAGIVCASLEKFDHSFPLSVLCTEGFGPAFMPKKLREYLVSFSVRTAVVSPMRQQLIIPGIKDEGLPVEEEMVGRREILPGMLVQVLAWPYFGQEAVVTEIIGDYLFESGISVPALSVRLIESQDLIKIPVENVLILD